MRSKQSKAFGKSLGLLLLFVNALSVVKPIATQAQVVPTSLSADTPSAAESICPAQLEKAIDAIVNRPQFARSRWGLLIQTLSSSQTLYSRDAQKYFIPASNVKLLTTAAALHHLGAEFKIRTSVYAVEDPRIKDVNLYVVGRGDPSLTDAQLQQLAQQLKRRGVGQVRSLILESDRYLEPVVNPSWEWEDVQASYGAPVNSAIVNQNAATLMLSPQQLGEPLRVSWVDPIAETQWELVNVSVTTETGSQPSIEVNRLPGRLVLQVRGQLPVNSQPQSVSLAILDPAKNFLKHFQSALETQKITVTQTAVIFSGFESDRSELAAVESSPLATLLMETNQNSNNLYAEALLRSLGATEKPESVSFREKMNFSEMGLAVVKATLTELGVNPESYIIVDGSGLSRHNLVTPEALVQTLKAVNRTPEAAIYRASLPVAGKSGTLQNRFLNTPAVGILQAKTGSMSGVSALSGYLDAPNYQPLVFSIIVNQSDKPGATVRQAIDEVAVTLTRLRRC